MGKLCLSFRIFHNGQLVRETQLTQGVIKIGKVPSAHLKIDDDKVSRMHAIIEVLGTDVSVIDLGSTGGTFVNGQKINKAKLVTGDAITVGDTRIELVMPLHDKSEVSAFLEKRGGGIHHIALKTDDVDGDVAELKAKGVKIAQDPAPGAHGCRVAFIHPKATGGVLLELSTPPPDNAPTR